MSMQQTIQDKIQQQLTPLHLEVVDESHMHSVPEGAESHFKITVVTEQFQDEKLVTRHRRVYAILADELQNSVHALALHTLTPNEWFEKGGTVPASPPCEGGSKA